MVERERSNDDDNYEYANSYFYFFKVLTILSLDAAEQCQMLGHFAVAWELRDELSRGGAAVLNSPAGQLSNDAKKLIGELLEDLRQVPDEVVHADNTRLKHLESMNNPFWEPLRTRGKELIEMLRGETQRTNAILWPVQFSGPPTQ